MLFSGDQAEIVFTLIGEPPFTFTYQRSEPSPKKGIKPGKVLETHTVTGVFTKEYSIFSALEGWLNRSYYSLVKIANELYPRYLDSDINLRPSLSLSASTT